jgi:hypothetical protein
LLRVALQRNFDLYIPRKGTAQPQSQFPHSCVFERFIFSQDRSTYFPASEYADRPTEYINLIRKYECRSWDCGSAVLFLKIYVSNLGIVSLQCGKFLIVWGIAWNAQKHCLKGQRREMFILFEGLNILISTFYVCADGFQGLSKAFHYTIINY